MSNYAPDQFRTFVSGEESIGSFIRSGGLNTSPYWNGGTTAAANFNHLLANSHKPIIEQCGSATIPWVENPNIPFATYVVRAPRLHNRRTLRVEVTATTTTPIRFQIHANLYGQSTFTSSVTSSGGTAICDVETLDDSLWDTLTLGFTLDEAGDFTVTHVRAYSLPSGTDLGTIQEVIGTGFVLNGPVYTPQDLAQWGVDEPLTVAMVSDLVVGLRGMYRDNLGALVNWCWWGDQTEYVTGEDGLKINYSATIYAPVARSQYIYYPRPGVKFLTCFVMAHVTDYASAAGYLSFNWIGSTSGVKAPIVSGTSTVTRGSWAVWEYNLRVPESSGPIYLDLRGMGSTDGSLIIQSVAVFENPDEVV